MAPKSGQKRKGPAYSGDTLALRAIAGLALIALGAVIFLAVDLGMKGNIFDGLRTVCCGLCGSMAMILPVIFIWAGILVFWSTQRKAPVRPFIWASLAFVGVCAFIAVTNPYPGYQSYLHYLTENGIAGWTDAIQKAQRETASPVGGGSLGVAVAWPFWRVTGNILGAVIFAVGTLGSLLMAVNLTPDRLRDLAKGKISLRRDRQSEERVRGEDEQIRWQQEQARQREMERQQQAYMLQQQQQMRQPPAWPARNSAVPQGTGPQPDVGGNRGGVETWQEQLTGRMAGVGTGAPRTSRIFGRGGQPQTGGTEAKHFISRIFGRREEPDGLSEASREEKRQAGRSLFAPHEPAEENGPRAARGAERPGTDTAEENRADARAEEENARRTATGKELKRPQSRWNAAEQDEDVQEIYRNANRKNREDRQPAEPPAGEAAPAAGEPAKDGSRKGGKSSWADQVRAAEAAAAGKAGEGSGTAGESAIFGTAGKKESSGSAGEDRAFRPAEDRRTKEREPAPQVTVPKVQQEIGTQAWKPELNRVEPRTESGAGEEYWEPTPYYAPPITDLRMPQASRESTAEEDEERSRRLEETLASFRVQARVVHVTHGPAISRFELELASGTKVNKVAELEKDIAYGMEATSVRIEAPIPGKSLVGVEVPNRKVATVTLREVLESPAMQNAKSILTVALGKDIAGTPVVCDLARMPHMLIAGATGSGKSVCINAIINSLLYRAGPEEVKMILVDPKVVELQVYNNIPHLLIPVVNDPHKASAALAWAVAEMMDRYDRFARAKVRNLDGYNSALGPHEKPMPRIVIIIDELADLMMVCKKDVEEYICRITQLARAAGIHLIVATQRPSVDVITGLIKANIPSRIAFKTASYVDSRTILDRNGSEQLLGWGDMLYLPTGSFSPTRVQGCFLSDEEVNKIVAHVKEANPGNYDPDILDRLEKMGSESGESQGMDMIGGAADNPSADSGLFEQAVEFAIADGQISTSTLQRRLKVGYARAGRLTDEMEERGIISAKDGSKPRKCLITREEWEAMKQSTEGMA